MFKAFNRQNPCPACGNTKGKCRQSDNELILCMNYPDGGDLPGWQFLKTNKNGLWGLWKPATEQPQTYLRSVAPKVERIYSTLTHKERDRIIRSLWRHLGLRAADRERLRARGLTDFGIDAGLFFSLDKEIELDFHFPHIPDNFPGVFRRGNQRFLRSHRGIAIPTFDEQGFAIGLQIRLESPGEGGKYRWLKDSHLSNGELPLTVAYPCDDSTARLSAHAEVRTSILLTEGILKPFIAAQKHRAIAIGASGGNFSASPEQLKTALNTLNAQSVLLCPDGGSVQNRHVFRQYSKLKELLDSRGIELKVLWWGQTEKSHPDIDELDSLDSTQVISWDELRKIAASYGVKVEPVKSGLISASEWMKRFGQASPIQSISTLIASQARSLYKALRSKSTTQSECLAIVPYKRPIIEALEYHKVGDLPLYSEWVEMGCPEIRFAPGRRIDFYSEAKQKGFKYLQDASTTGCGKSFDAGLLTTKVLHLKKKHPITILANNHRNPTTETIETHFADQVVRHAGLIKDHAHSTALGYPHLRLAKPGEQPDIAANCVQPETFHTLAKRGIAISPGSDNPVCAACPDLELCKVDGFLGQKRDLYAKSDRRIRSSIDSVAPTDSVLVLDDSINEIRTEKTFEVERREVDRVYRLVSEQYPQHQKVVLPILRSLTALLQQETGKYGLGDTETRAALPTVKDLEDCLNSSVSLQGTSVGLVHNNWLTCRDVWDLPTSLEELAKAFEEIREGNLEEILERYCDDLPAKLTAIQEQLLPPWLPALLRASKSSRSFLNLVDGKLQITVPDYRHRNVIKASPFVAVLDATLSKGDLAMVLGVRKKQILRVSQILKPVAEKSEPFENLTIKIVKGIGQCGRDRRDTQQERVNAAIGEILAQAPGQVGLIDFKDKLSNYANLNVNASTTLDINPEPSRSPSIPLPRVKLGHWFHDNRGSNEFSGCSDLIAVGTPQVNLNAARAQWQILTGKPATGGEFMAWYRRKVVSEQVQFCGRLRAQLVPQSKSIWILGDCDGSALYEAFPGVKIETLEAFQLCPEAAPKEQQTKWAIFKAAESLIETGKKLTQTAIAPLAKISQGRIAQIAAQFGGWQCLKKVLVLLYRLLKSKTNNLNTGLSEEEIWMAQSYLPVLMADYESGAISPVEAIEMFSRIFQSYGWAKFQAIVESTPLEIKAKLLGVLLALSSDGGLPENCRDGPLPAT